jgi:sphinganine C4-monooxygenase
MASNTTLAFDLPPLPSYELRPLPYLIPGFSDKYLTLALPVIAYWAVSGMFHIIDTLDLFPHYRLHTPAEILKRNHATRWEVFRDVILQQIIQTIVGVVLSATEGPDMCGKEEYDIAVWARRLRILQRGIPVLLSLVGVNAGLLSKRVAESNPSLAGALAGGRYPSLLQIISIDGHTTIAPAFAAWEHLTAKAIYHVLIPALQFFIAILVVDTWQYFWHRGMHLNKYLYTTFHSRHHRLYVPYAYGALYNHPVEGFLLDTLGTAVAYLLSSMTTRQSMWFFTISTIKTVDDHCGYALPWDPLQLITSNNAGYHDIHHQSWGIKTNFSQPFFTFWDRFMGTMWAGGDVSARYGRMKKAAQVWYEKEYSVSHTMPIDQKAHAERIEPYDEDAEPAEGLDAIPPAVPNSKATAQAVSSRKQVRDDPDGGARVFMEEAAEERRESRDKESVPLRRSSPRKKSAKTAPGLNGHVGIQRVDNR